MIIYRLRIGDIFLAMDLRPIVSLIMRLLFSILRCPGLKVKFFDP